MPFICQIWLLRVCREISRRAGITWRGTPLWRSFKIFFWALLNFIGVEPDGKGFFANRGMPMVSSRCFTSSCEIYLPAFSQRATHFWYLLQSRHDFISLGDYLLTDIRIPKAKWEFTGFPLFFSFPWPILWAGNLECYLPADQTVINL